MKVMKFGGTSVGKPERMHQIVSLVTKQTEPVIVVLSALSGTTNVLIEIGTHIANGDRNTAKQSIDKLETHYQSFITQLLKKSEMIAKAKAITAEHFEFLNIILKISFSEALSKDILAQGELLATKLFCVYLEEQGIDHLLLPALEFMTIDSYDEPQIGSIKVRLSQLLTQHNNKNIFVTQGDETTARIESNDNSYTSISMETIKNKLIISSEDDSRVDKNVNIYITIKDLNTIKLSGSGNITFLNKVNCANLFSK